MDMLTDLDSLMQSSPFIVAGYFINKLLKDFKDHTARQDTKIDYLTSEVAFLKASQVTVRDMMEPAPYHRHQNPPEFQPRSTEDF